MVNYVFWRRSGDQFFSPDYWLTQSPFKTPLNLTAIFHDPDRERSDPGEIFITILWFEQKFWKYNSFVIAVVASVGAVTIGSSAA